MDLSECYESDFLNEKEGMYVSSEIYTSAFTVGAL